MPGARRGLAAIAVWVGLGNAVPPIVAAQTPVYVTQWGSQGSGEGQFRNPGGLACDVVGDVYVADSNNNRVQKFSNTGAYLLQWGGLGFGPGQFNAPSGVAVDGAGDVYVADDRNSRIQKFTSAGVYLTDWGSFGSGDGQMNRPGGVATDAAGDVYVADAFNNRIQKFTATGNYLTQWSTPNPTGVATNGSGNVYVTDPLNHRVRKFTGTGALFTEWGSPGTGDGQFDQAPGVGTDAAGNVYVAETEGQIPSPSSHRIQKFTGAGAYLTQWGTFGTGNGEFNVPFAVATDGLGNIFVSDRNNHRIQKFSPSATPVVRSTWGAPQGPLSVTSDSPPWRARDRIARSS